MLALHPSMAALARVFNRACYQPWLPLSGLGTTSAPWAQSWRPSSGARCLGEASGLCWGILLCEALQVHLPGPLGRGDKATRVVWLGQQPFPENPGPGGRSAGSVGSRPGVPCRVGARCSMVSRVLHPG